MIGAARNLPGSCGVQWDDVSDTGCDSGSAEGRRSDAQVDGPDDRRATKVAVGVIGAEGAEPSALERWVSSESDVRTDPAIGLEILNFIESQGVKSVVMADRIIGCPHEEGTDYPDSQICPHCPFWAHRDRWSGHVLH